MIITVLILSYIIFYYDGMGIVKDINELPLATKAIFISLCIFLPCWSIILYYFFPLILNLEWYKILGFAFVPTMIWYALEYGTVKFALSSLYKTYQIQLSDKVEWIITIMDGMLYLILLTIIAYYSHFTFETYLWIVFSFRLFAFVYFLILDIIIKP
jgi:hypothetical protein